MSVKLNVSEKGMVKRMMKAGRDFVTEEVTEGIARFMIDNAINVEPSGNSDYPVLVITQSGAVFYVDGEFEKGESVDEEILED